MFRITKYKKTTQILKICVVFYFTFILKIGQIFVEAH
mgnify:CR=1 FL=1